MLEVHNLSISIRDQQQAWRKVVHDLNFHINSGEVLGIIGESGSGKTLTGLSILRLLPHVAAYGRESKILLHGSELLNLSEVEMQKVRGADIAMIFQEPMTSLNPIYTAGQQITEVLKIHRHMRGRYADIEAMRLLEAVRIQHPLRCFKSYPHELSGGMQQRVMIAMALACKPSLLIADEPTTALDVTTQAKILELLFELQRAENMAMILVTHDLSIAAQMADRIIVMQNGRMVEQSATVDFFKSPRDSYSLQLLNSSPANLKLPKHNSKEHVSIMSVSALNVSFPIKRGILKKTVEHVHAVHNVSFNLYAGKTTAIVGESGSGKSTLAKAILGLTTQATGNVIYNGENLLCLSNKQWLKYRSDIQIIFQDPYSALDAKLPIIDSLVEGMRLLGKYTREEMYAKIDKLLVAVGLKPEHKWRYPHEFSGGERQRICIARALTVDPKIIICDEPTSSLDVSVQAQVLELLLKLQQEENLSYLFITHDLNIVRLMANYVVVMHQGNIVEEGLVQTVFESPQSAYTLKLLSAIPKIPT